MTSSLISGSAGDDAEADQTNSSREPPQRGGRYQHRRQRELPPLPTEQDCLRALNQIPSLLVMGLMKPATATAMRGVYAEMLRSLRHAEASGVQTTQRQEELFEYAQRNPEAATLLEPFLTDEQIAMVMADGGDDARMGKFEFCEQFVFLDGRLISFTGRPYLPAIYGAAQRNLVLRCSRQTEKSTFLVNTILYTACTQPHAKILFVCPRQEQALAFSNFRLRPAIEQSPIVHRCLVGRRPRRLPVTNLTFANGATLFIRAAYHSADACRGLSADLLMVDEFQDIAAGDLPVLQETLSHAHHGRTILTGTPKSVDNHLESMFAQSTAHEWMTQCPACQQVSLPNDRCLGPQGIICPSCQAALDPAQGYWQPRNPQATWGDGFWISHLMVPWLNHNELLQRQCSYDPARFKNECLGLPTTLGDHIITREEAELCCDNYAMASSGGQLPAPMQRRLVAGIDWGGGATARTSVVIGYMADNFTFYVVHLARFAAREEPNVVLHEVAALLKRFGIQWIAADGGGTGYVYNRLLVEALGGPCYFYAILYSMTDHPPQPDGILWKWTVGRSPSIGVLFTRIKNRHVVFPHVLQSGSFLDEIVCEVAEYDEHQRSVRYTHPETQPDDTLHALNYALLVGTRRWHGQHAV